MNMGGNVGPDGAGARERCVHHATARTSARYVKFRAPTCRRSGKRRAVLRQKGELGHGPLGGMGIELRLGSTTSVPAQYRPDRGAVPILHFQGEAE